MEQIKLDEIKQAASELFYSGYNCAQSVVSSFTDFLEIDNQTALNFAVGFGGGMGRLQETCGALTGAYLVLGLHNGKKFSDNSDKVDATYPMIQQIEKDFTQINGASSCRSLINCDLNIEEGQAEFKEKDLKKKVCEKCIHSSIELVVTIFEE